MIDLSRSSRAHEPDRQPDGRDRLREPAVCSLEGLNDVWRRNQFFVGALLRRNPELRVLYVEPPARSARARVRMFRPPW